MNNSTTAEEEANITIDTRTIDTNNNNNINNNDDEKKRNRSYYQKKSDIISGYKKVVTCRVDGCSTTCKNNYELKARVCLEHLKAESVRFEQDSSCVFKRFCQKCTRFEDLHLFDCKKRACRASLEKLNSKRRENYTKDEDDDKDKDGGGGSLLLTTIANINNNDVVPKKDESYKEDSKQRTTTVSSDEEDDEKKLDIIDIAKQLVNIIALDEMRKKKEQRIIASSK